jgi:hypothetical protein
LIGQLNNRLRNIRIESEALRLEEEALVARIAYIEAQERVHEVAAPETIAIGDRVCILNPGPGRRHPRDTVGHVLSITAHFITVRTDSNLIVKRDRPLVRDKQETKSHRKRKAVNMERSLENIPSKTTSKMPITRKLRISPAIQLKCMDMYSKCSPKATVKNSSQRL